MSMSPPGEDFVLISNRQPYRHYYADDGSIKVDRPAGGLTAGLDPVMQQTDGTWIAWGDGEADDAVTDNNGTMRVPPEEQAYTLKRVWLPDEEVEGYYYGYSNRVLWPLCHGGIWKTEYANRNWARYQQANEKFADAITERADSKSVIWFQDYHFSLAPRLIRNAIPDSFLMHFWHIPWPGLNTFQTCPQQQELLDGLLGNDLLGFHIQNYCENFLDCVEECLDEAIVDREDGQIQYRNHTTTVRAFPMGIDAEVMQTASSNKGQPFWNRFRREYEIAPNTKIAVGVDRLDYTKGILERLDALERFWVTEPKWRGNLTYVQKADESRSRIPDYQNLQQNVEDAVTRINDRFRTDDWRPIIYIDDWLTEDELAGLYRHGDILLVSALRDGMNLVTKEYVAAQTAEPGVLVLSNQTGAYEELGDDAVTINPHDTDKFAATIETALTMDEKERRERMAVLQKQVMENDLVEWMSDIFETASRLRDEKE
nr:trehalose-6-phosphate synthase [Haladaptatus caseinilyticus]